MAQKSFYTEDKFNKKFEDAGYNISQDKQKFKELIGIDNFPEDDELEALVDTYVSFNHKASLWYQIKHDEKVKTIEKYQKGRIGILLLLPVLILIITLILKDNSTSSSVAVIISGLIAAYRASSQWIEAKITSSSFINTASSLKINIYEFQKEWKKEWSSENIATLKSALKLGIKSAKELIDNQRKTYFESTLPKQIDPMNEIMTSLNEVKSLIGKMK